MTKDIEITTEANPNSASKEWLEGMKSLGVNRVSFGVQSFNENKLKELNRSHSPNDAITAIKNAKNIGIKNISLDLIYNYKGDTKELLLNDINQAFNLPINHISAYELTIEENTHFYKTPKVAQNNEELAFFVNKEIEKRGFNAYEISNFGSYQSKHNKGYWELKDYIGIGSGAVGFKEDRRFYTQKNIDKYIENPLEIEIEILSKEDILTEKIFLGLRSSIGINKNILDTNMIQKADFLVKKSKLKYENNRYYNLDFFISDEIALYILE
jgi:oxygen-independent coproporphyrinogen-3 oxidase